MNTSKNLFIDWMTVLLWFATNGALISLSGEFLFLLFFIKTLISGQHSSQHLHFLPFVPSVSHHVFFSLFILLVLFLFFAVFQILSGDTIDAYFSVVLSFIKLFIWWNIFALFIFVCFCLRIICKRFKESVWDSQNFHVQSFGACFHPSDSRLVFLNSPSFSKKD